MALQTKRVYEPAEEKDGKRILVDRLWPRGVSKKRAQLDGWFKELAPSTELREWFGHEKERFEQFAQRYREELDANPNAQKEVQALEEMSKQQTVTLLYGAKDPQLNQAIVLKDYLDNRADSKKQVSA